jgi:methionyl aminopeptidase
MKLALPPAYFCNQECFKRYWPVHKTFHKKEEEKEVQKKSFKYTVFNIDIFFFRDH